jgi:hypothetical protein
MKIRILTALFGVCACVQHTAHGVTAQTPEIQQLSDDCNRAAEIYKPLLDETLPPEHLALHPKHGWRMQAETALNGAFICLTNNDLRGARGNLNNHFHFIDNTFKNLSYPNEKAREIIWQLRTGYTQYMWHHGQDALNALPGIERVKMLLKMSPWDVTPETIEEFPEAHELQQTLNKPNKL